MLHLEEVNEGKNEGLLDWKEEAEGKESDLDGEESVLGYFLAHTGDSSVGLGHLPLGRPTRFERRFLFSISPNLLFC